MLIEYKIANNGFVAAHLDTPIPIQEYSHMSVAVKGDSKGTILEAVYVTPYGEVNQEVCTIDFDGYKRFAVDSSTAAALKGFNVRNKTGGAVKGEVYIDRIAVSEHFEIEDTVAPEISVSYQDNMLTANVTDGVSGSGVDGKGAVIKVNGKEKQHTYQEGILNLDISDISNETVSIGVTEVCDIVGNRARDITLLKNKDDIGFSTIADVQAGKWDSDYIRYCFEKGYISGIPEKEGLMFKGTNNITRAEFCVMLVSRTGIDISKYAGVTLPYTDADQIPSWAILYVKAAYEEKIMVGGGDTFNPSANITRAEVASAATNITEIDDRLSRNITYTDAQEIPSWAQDTVKTATNQCIFEGDEKGAFRPMGLLTRSEAAVVMTQIITK